MRCPPLPSFSWANGADVWNCMLEKDANYAKLRSERVLERHPSLVDSYRTILFDWLSEVSQECKFHRETYHLALDFIDRYLWAQSNVNKYQLQLIGTTCLFLAAKYEEIRPPTVIEFADLTDGACRPEDIVENEVTILSAINWDITPMTPNNWLNIYMQILLKLSQQDEEQQEELEAAKETTSTNKVKPSSRPSNRNASPQHVSDENSSTPTKHLQFLRHSTVNCSIKDDSFILPANNGIFKSKYKRIASAIDLALLHIESLRYHNSILTAAALYHFTDENTVKQCTGFEYRELADCIRWLRPFIETIKDIREPVFLANFNGQSQSTQLHTHVATAKLLDKVSLKMEEEAVRLTLKRKGCSLTEDEITDSESDSILLSTTQTSTLLTPPKREPHIRKSRRIH